MNKNLPSNTDADDEKKPPATLTDEQLFSLCKKYGENARHWKQKFAGLLPEVLQRRLYDKRGFSSIFEFAAKLAGMSNEQVRLVLNLKRKFEATPALQSLLLTGEVSANKLVRVAAIATAENQEFLAQHVRILSNRALETLAKDFKTSDNPTPSAQNRAGKITNPNGSQKPLFEVKSLHVHSKTYDIGAIVKIMEKLSPEVQNKLLDLVDKNIDINEIILEALNNREAGLTRAKAEISHDIKVTDSRHIPAAIRKIINEEQGDRCSVPGCRKPAGIIHHEIPFAIAKTHDPGNLRKLCRAHHEIRHSINIKFYAIKKMAMDTS